MRFRKTAWSRFAHRPRAWRLIGRIWRRDRGNTYWRRREWRSGFCIWATFREGVRWGAGWGSRICFTGSRSRWRRAVRHSCFWRQAGRRRTETTVAFGVMRRERTGRTQSENHRLGHGRLASMPYHFSWNFAGRRPIPTDDRSLSESLYGRMRSAPFGIAKECFLRARVVPTVAVAALRRELIDIVVNALVAVPEDGTIRADFAKSSPNRPRAIDRCQAPSIGPALV